MNDLNNIEEQFRNQLQEMEVSTKASAADMWTRIEGELPPTRRIAWYWVGGAIALLILGFGVGYFIANPKNVAQQYTGESHDLPTFQPTERSFDSTPIVTSSSTNNTPVASDKKANKSASNATSSDIAVVVSKEKTVNTKTAKADKTYVNSSIKQKANPNTPQRKIVQENTTINQITIANKISTDNVFVGEKPDIRTDATLTSSANSSLHESNLDDQPIIESITYKGNPPHLDNLNQGSLQIRPYSMGFHSLHPRFQFGLAYMPQITLLKGTENTTYPIQYGHGYSAFILKSKDRYYYSLGVEYNQTKFGYRYHEETNSTFTYYNQLLHVNQNQDGTYTNVYGDTTVNAKVTTDVAYNNVYKQMGFNLELGKQWYLGRSSVLAGIQANLYYIPQQNARYTNRDNTYTGVVRQTQSGMKKMIVVPAITAQWRYQVAPLWNIHAGIRLAVLPSYIWSSEQKSTLFRPNLMLGISRTIAR